MALLTTTPARRITPIITIISIDCPVTTSPQITPINANGIEPIIIIGIIKLSNCEASSA